MAQIVLGIGTSHGPMLSTPPDRWGERVPADRTTQQWYKGKQYSFDDLAELRRDDHFERQAVPEIWKERHTACRAALDELAAVFADARIDVAVIVGNDQMEMFSDVVIPAISVYKGETIPNEFPSEERLARLPPGIGVSVPGHVPPEGAFYSGHPELAKWIIEHAMADEFDVAALGKLPAGCPYIPHAFGFIYRQIMKDQVVPSVPVVLNTFYPPNQPSVDRCYKFGKSLLRAIESWDSDARVALISSGGLTHFVIDEDIDQAFFDAVKERKIEKLAELGEGIFQAGTSEIKNWVPLAGAMADLGYPPTIVDYVPCYRSEAGTGNAMGFVYWKPAAG